MSFRSLRKKKANLVKRELTYLNQFSRQLFGVVGSRIHQQQVARFAQPSHKVRQQDSRHYHYIFPEVNLRIYEVLDSDEYDTSLQDPSKTQNNQNNSSAADSKMIVTGLYSRPLAEKTCSFTIIIP